MRVLLCVRACIIVCKVRVLLCVTFKVIIIYFSRDEAQHRLQLIRERFDRDVTAYNAELKDLLRVIDHENKLRHFMDTKMEERAESYDVLVKERIQKKLFGDIRALNVDVENYENVFKQLFKVSIKISI